MAPRLAGIVGIDPLPVALAALALALRLPYLAGRSLWYDEASSWQTASFPLPELLPSLRRNVHMPLYYLLLKAWMAVFGDSVAALRGLSVALGVLTVLLVDRLAREVYRASAAADESGGEGATRRARAFGLATGALVACSPFQVQASIEARMYATGTTLTALSGWLLLVILRRGGRGPLWWPFGATCLALAYTHHYGVLTVASWFALLYGAGMWRLGAGEMDEARRLLGRAALVAAAVAIGYLPGLGILRGQVAHVRREYWIRPLSLQTLPDSFAEFAIPMPEGADPAPVGWLAAGVFAAACIVVARRARVGDAFVLVAALGPMTLSAALSTVTPIWVPRYFRFAHLAMLTTLSLAAWRATRSLPALRAVALLGLTGILLASNVAFWRALELGTKPGPRGVAQRVLAGYRPGELVLTTDHVQYFPLKYYAGRRARVRILRPLFEPEWGDHLIRPADLIGPAELAESGMRGVWVVGKTPRPTGLELPEGMTAAEHYHVRYYHRLHGNLYVTHFVRPEAGGAALGREEGESWPSDGSVEASR